MGERAGTGTPCLTAAAEVWRRTTAAAGRRVSSPSTNQGTRRKCLGSVRLLAMPRAIVEPRGNAAAGGRVEREADDLTPSGSRQLSQWELAALPVGVSKIPLGIPLGAFGGASGSFKKRLEKRVGAQGVRLAAGQVAARAARRPSQTPTRRPHWEPRHYWTRATSSAVPSYRLFSP